MLLLLGCFLRSYTVIITVSVANNVVSINGVFYIGVPQFPFYFKGINNWSGSLWVKCEIAKQGIIAVETTFHVHILIFFCLIHAASTRIVLEAVIRVKHPCKIGMICCILKTEGFCIKVNIHYQKNAPLNGYNAMGLHRQTFDLCVVEGTFILTSI